MPFNCTSFKCFQGQCFVAVLITPMKCSPMWHSPSAVCTTEKAESAMTSHLVLAHGTTNSLSAHVPLSMEGPSYCDSSWAEQALVLRILSLILIPLSPQQTSTPLHHSLACSPWACTWEDHGLSNHLHFHANGPWTH